MVECNYNRKFPMLEFKTPLVINDAFGGFSLTAEMVRRLKERGCGWADDCYQTSDPNVYYPPYRDNLKDTLRNDEDLVAVVRELTVEYDKKAEDIESWQERRVLAQELLADLKVVEVRVLIQIDDYDGKESVSVSGGLW